MNNWSVKCVKGKNDADMEEGLVERERWYNYSVCTQENYSDNYDGGGGEGNQEQKQNYYVYVGRVHKWGFH